MNHSTKETYIRQLIQLRDERITFLNDYFPEHGSRRSHMEKLLAGYCDKIEHSLSSGDDSWKRMVLIGSSVTVTYVEDQMTDTFVIVFPIDADPEHNRISFISPIAEQLLLRSQGDIFSMETNMGELHVRIDRIDSDSVPFAGNCSIVREDISSSF